MEPRWSDFNRHSPLWWEKCLTRSYEGIGTGVEIRFLRIYCESESRREMTRGIVKMLSRLKACERFHTVANETCVGAR